MTSKRPKSLKWVGAMLPDGRPERFLDFLPPEDIDETRTDDLTQEQLTIVRNSELYREVHDTPKKKTAAKVTAKSPAASPEPAGATEPSDTGDEPSTAAETATES